MKSWHLVVFGNYHAYSSVWGLRVRFGAAGLSRIHRACSGNYGLPELTPSHKEAHTYYECCVTCAFDTSISFATAAVVWTASMKSGFLIQDLHVQSPHYPAASWFIMRGPLESLLRKYLYMCIYMYICASPARPVLRSPLFVSASVLSLLRLSCHCDFLFSRVSIIHTKNP